MLEKLLARDFMDVVEQAAIACARLTGKGRKDDADQLATEAMRRQMETIEMQGRIVIGEGERDEAPMLYIGEEVGSGKGVGVDIAVDPSGRNESLCRWCPWGIGYFGCINPWWFISSSRYVYGKAGCWAQ